MEDSLKKSIDRKSQDDTFLKKFLKEVLESRVISGEIGVPETTKKEILEKSQHQKNFSKANHRIPGGIRGKIPGRMS